MRLHLSLLPVGRVAWLANEGERLGITLFLPNHLAAAKDGEEHWVQLSPFGDFGNTSGGARVIQRFRKEDATRICNEFNSTLRRVTQPLGMPFYIGHPDHPRFAGQPGHADTRAYGRGKEMAVRHDAGCERCTAFVNARGEGGDAAPCQEHGLFVRMHWNDEGARLIGNESYHGHSVNWAAAPEGMENGVQVYRPVRVKSAGFTNEPNIPVRPASLANAEGEALVPARLKVLAGYGAEDEVTMEDVIAALERGRVVEHGNEAGRIGELEELLANERRERATALVEGLIKNGKIITRERDGVIAELCNAGNNYDAVAARLGDVRTVVKTRARSIGLAGTQARAVEGERERTARFQQMMDVREREFPNEGYEERFRVVANSNEGAHLLAQMSRGGEEE